jgi:hypothetical protein
MQEMIYPFRILVTVGETLRVESLGCFICSLFAISSSISPSLPTWLFLYCFTAHQPVGAVFEINILPATAEEFSMVNEAEDVEIDYNITLSKFKGPLTVLSLLLPPRF